MATVILACKTPAGFIMEVNGVKLQINGYNSKENVIRYDNGQLIGITYDVPKDFWDAWRAKHVNHPLVAGSEPYKQPFVFEAKSEASVKAIAKETKEVKTGLEQKTVAELEKVAGAKKDNSNPED